MPRVVDMKIVKRRRADKLALILIDETIQEEFSAEVMAAWDRK